MLDIGIGVKVMVYIVQFSTTSTPSSLLFPHSRLSSFYLTRARPTQLAGVISKQLSDIDFLNFAVSGGLASTSLAIFISWEILHLISQVKLAVDHGISYFCFQALVVRMKR
jgi:hypothetical protein